MCASLIGTAREKKAPPFSMTLNFLFSNGFGVRWNLITVMISTSWAA
jgi:hypothetical protein